MTAITLEQKYNAVIEENAALRAQLDAAQQRIDWFQRQLFGNKSEKQLAIDPAVQQSLLAGLVDDAPAEPAAEYETKPVKKRRKLRNGAVNDTGLRFDDSVPVRVINVPAPEGLADGEVIATHSTFRLAQRRASYEVLEYRTPVIKSPTTGKPQTTPTPDNIFGGSIADVSFLAGMLVDKFAYHLPLYRQHQRLLQAGFQLSRATLTQLVARAAALLAPIHQAQLENVLASDVLAMDETPIKAGRKSKGKLNNAYFWPLYGDCDEISFTFANTRGKSHIEKVLAEHFSGTLLTDGYGAYVSYAQKQPGVTHAQCWAHTRRQFETAKAYDPQTQEGLVLIAGLYKQEAWIREKNLEGPDKQQARTQRCEPIVKRFWQWCDTQCQRLDLEPKHPLAKALAYALNRKPELEVFLGDPAVPMDTNHLERGLRPIPLGRRNWLFCWSEVGAQHVGIIQSLLSTCRLHGVDPYTYFVDVLQRVGIHPASRVHELTPRLWKQHFADNPLRSDVERFDHRPD